MGIKNASYFRSIIILIAGMLTFVLSDSVVHTTWFAILPLVIALLGCIFWRKIFQQNPLRSQRFLLESIFLFMGIVGVSTIFSIHVPMSLYQLVYFIILFCCFFIMNRVFSRENLVFFIIGAASGGMIFLSILSFLQHPLTLSDLSVFSHMYEHLHIDFVLLAVLPLYITYVFQHFSIAPKILQWGSVVGGLAIIFFIFFSQSEVSILLMVLEMFTVWALFQKRTRILYGGVASFFLLVTLVSMGIIISLFTCVHLENNCLQLFSGRAEYWFQGFSAIKERPLLGFGPGTFGAISEQFMTRPYRASLFSHNIFLDLASTVGLLGSSIFIFTLGRVVKKSLENLNKNKEKTAFFIALLALLTKLFFDYDFFLFPNGLVFVAVLSGALPKHKPFPKREMGRKWREQGLIGSALAFLLLYGIVWSATQTLIFMKKPSISFRLTPYFWQQMNDYIDHEDLLTPDQRQKLDQIYWNDPTYIKKRIALGSQNSSASEVYFERLFQLNPWYRLSFFLSSDYIRQGEITRAETSLYGNLEVFRLAEERGYVISYEDQQLFLQHMHELMEVFIQKGDIVQAAHWTLIAYQFDEWSMDQIVPASLFSLPPHDRFAYLGQIQQIPPERYGSTNSTFARAYLEWIVNDIQFTVSPNWKALGDRVQYVLAFGPWVQGEIWNDLSPALYQRYQQAGTIEEKQEILSFWDKLEVLTSQREWGEDWKKRLEQLQTV